MSIYAERARKRICSRPVCRDDQENFKEKSGKSRRACQYRYTSSPPLNKSRASQENKLNFSVDGQEEWLKEMIREGKQTDHMLDRALHGIHGQQKKMRKMRKNYGDTFFTLYKNNSLKNQAQLTADQAYASADAYLQKVYQGPTGEERTSRTAYRRESEPSCLRIGAGKRGSRSNKFASCRKSKPNHLKANRLKINAGKKTDSCPLKACSLQLQNDFSLTMESKKLYDQKNQLRQILRQLTLYARQEERKGENDPSVDKLNTLLKSAQQLEAKYS